MTQRVAIFDIDGTIFRSSLLIKLVDELIARGDFPPETKGIYEKYEHAWVERSGTYEAYIEKVVEVFRTHVKGLPYDSFRDAAKAIAKKERNLRYRYTSNLIKKLKKQNYFLLAVSQSPWIALEDFCKELGFDKVYGRFYELGPNEKLTGNVVGEELINDKGAIVRRAVKKHGLTLEGSFAVGDTENDVSMLSVVENPICFNPNKHLAKIAQSNGWEIVIERKDTIYEWSTSTNKIRLS